MIGLSAVAMATVTSNGGVATDDVTNLQWQDDDASIVTTKSWTEAIGYCEALDLGSKQDWRLPNKNELISIVDYDKASDVFVGGFSKVSSDFFWSSTTVADNADRAWLVYFGAGYADYDFKLNGYSVRCVRGGL